MECVFCFTTIAHPWVLFCIKPRTLLGGLSQEPAWDLGHDHPLLTHFPATSSQKDIKEPTFYLKQKNQETNQTNMKTLWSWKHRGTYFQFPQITKLRADILAVVQQGSTPVSSLLTSGLCSPRLPIQSTFSSPMILLTLSIPPSSFSLPSFISSEINETLR